MRPVFRDDIPTDSNGNSVVFKEYGDARNDLIDRIGDYCSYCEARLFTPAVEHIQPKSKESALEKSWHNFLLACCYCNGIKKDKSIDADTIRDYFWPDLDNTFFIFLYEKDRAPQISADLSEQNQLIAFSTLQLTGLDREFGHPLLSKKDRRWAERNAAWGKAERAKVHLSQNPSDAMRNQIIDTATSTGFWSVWMTVFQNDTDMRRRLIQAFKGTCSDCFDEATQPLPRLGGKL